MKICGKGTENRGERCTGCELRTDADDVHRSIRNQLCIPRMYMYILRIFAYVNDMTDSRIGMHAYLERRQTAKIESKRCREKKCS